MGYMVQITEDKFDKISELTEKVLKYGGKLMSCISELGEEHGIGERRGYGMREHEGGRYGGGHMGSRYPIYRGGMGYRDDEDWEDEEEMGERRRRNSRGRYM